MSALLEKLATNEEYIALRNRKRTVSYTLSAINVVVYMAYILCIAYAENIFAYQFGDSLINLGLWFTVFIIFFAFIVSGIYIWWTNTKYDPELQRLMKLSGLEV